MRKAYNPDGVADSTQYGYTQAIETEDGLYVAGQPGWDASGAVPEGVVAQAARAFDNVETVLASAGADLDDVVKVTCYLVDPAETLEPFLDVWEDRVGEPRPARTVVGVPSLADPAFLVELDVEAVPGG